MGEGKGRGMEGECTEYRTVGPDIYLGKRLIE